MEKMNRVRGFLIAIVLFALVLVAYTGSQITKEALLSDIHITASSSETIENYFPLAEGAYWVYEGTVKWETNKVITEDNVSWEVREKSVIWKMEVVERFERGLTVGYAMRGHPSDLAWYQEDRERSDYAIIQVGTTKFYQTGIETLDRLQDATDNLHGLVHGANQFLDVPLIPDKKFCDDEHMTYLDGMYCWVVHEEKQIALDGIEGVPVGKTQRAYTLYFATNPDHIIVQFVPGVGITHYVYVHHGTVSEVDVELVEYHPGN